MAVVSAGLLAQEAGADSFSLLGRQSSIATMARRFDAHTQASQACLRAESWLMLRTMLLSTGFYTCTALGLVLHAQGHGPVRAVRKQMATVGNILQTAKNLCIHHGAN